jgi:hypothetical protein
MARSDQRATERETLEAALDSLKISCTSLAARETGGAGLGFSGHRGEAVFAPVYQHRREPEMLLLVG